MTRRRNQYWLGRSRQVNRLLSYGSIQRAFPWCPSGIKISGPSFFAAPASLPISFFHQSRVAQLVLESKRRQPDQPEAGASLLFSTKRDATVDEDVRLRIFWRALEDIANKTPVMNVYHFHWPSSTNGAQYTGWENCCADDLMGIDPLSELCE